LSTDGENLDVEDFDTEQDVYLELTHRSPTTTLIGQLGANLRDVGQSIMYGGFSWDSSFRNTWLGRLGLFINEISEETPALRVLGVKDRLSFGIFHNLTSREYARFQLNLQHYYTRERQSLATGYRIEAEMGHFILRHSPSWQIRLQGSREENDLSTQLPPKLVETIVPPEYSLLGIGTTIAQGVPLEEAMKGYSALVDAWIGWAWPTSALGYNLQIGLGVSASGSDQLMLTAFYSNTAGGRTDSVYKGVKIQYTLLF
jgi:hypothetical protein